MTASSQSSSAEMWLPHSPVEAIGTGRRILHVATRFLRGGAERNIAHTIAWERAAGFDVELALGPDSELDAIPAEIPLHLLSKLRRTVHPRDAAAIRELRSLITLGGFDIVHTHLSKAGVVGRLAARGAARRVVHTVHMASFGPGYHPAASTMYRLAERICAPMGAATVFVGNDLLDLYVRAGITKRERTAVIRSPIEVDAFLSLRSVPAWDRQRLRERMGLRPSGPVLLTIGSLEPRKRHEMLIRALESFLRERSGQLVIAGDGPLRTRLEVAVRSAGLEGHVVLLGHVPDVRNALVTADALVHASSAEGVPQAVIQAFAAGLPVVATDVTGLREIPRAPVEVVDRGGRDMVQAVRRVLDHELPPVPEAAFSQWTCAAIDRRTADLHKTLAQ